jgi:hypothetical protein
MLSPAASALGTPALSAGEQPACAANYSVTAETDGVGTAVGIPGFLVVEQVDVGSPATHAHVDALGISGAHAGAAYSQAAAANLGLVATLGLAEADASTIPVSATASHPAQPTASSSTPVASAEASSEAAAAAATIDASAGTLAGHVRGHAETRCGDDGVLRASADSTLESVAFGDGALRIGRVSTRATAATAADGTGTTESSMVVEAATVFGTPVAIEPQTGLPPASADALAQLADLGITIGTLSEAKDDDGLGVLGPGLTVTVQQRVPGIGTAASQVTYTMGRVYARAEGQRLQAAPTSGVVTVPSTSGAGSGQAPPPSPPASATSTAGADGTSSGSQATAVDGTSSAIRETGLASPIANASVLSWYVALVIGAAATAVRARVPRRKVVS